ncbi:MAG: hypothetical protein ACTS1Z_04280 [Parasphingopyxis sp.]|uniref:hypothetical protein n=1 Tax=Parasphingopyxis sp. TaxID=1920299 RepID=UPI003FA098B3
MSRRWLDRLIDVLAPDHRAQWVQAMKAEFSNIEGRWAAALFAIGCIIACLRFRLEPAATAVPTGEGIMRDRFTVAATIAGLAASLIGLIYLYGANAPATMMIVNVAAIIIGLLLAAAMRLTIRMTDRFLAACAVGASLVLLGTAFYGSAVEDARRWIAIGTFFVQTSLIFLPIVVIGFARNQSVWATFAVTVAALAMTVQPDRAMAGTLFVAVAVVVLIRPTMYGAAAAFVAMLAFAATLFRPAALPAVPFVDHILWSAFDIHIGLGLLLWAGCAMLPCAIVFVRQTDRSAMHFAFAAYWTGLVTAAALGAYPTPLVGYGASAIIGYFLSVAFIPPRVIVSRGVEGEAEKVASPSGRSGPLSRSISHCLTAQNSPQ